MQKFKFLGQFSLALILLGLGVYLFSSRQVLSLIPRLDNSNKPIGVIKISKLDNDKKGIEDTIWLPIKEGEIVYSGDYLKTSTQAEVVIGLIDELDTSKELRNKIILNSETYIRLFKNSDKFRLEIRSGLVRTDLETTLNLEISNGLQIDNLEIPPGLTEIFVFRNKATRIQNISNLINKKVKTDEPEKPEEETPEKEKQNQSERKIKELGPFPETDSVVLFKKQKTLKVLPLEKSLTDGSYSLSINKKIILENRIPAGIFPDLFLELNSQNSGLVEWTFDNGQVLKGQFWIYPFSTGLFGKALRESRKIILLD